MKEKSLKIKKREKRQWRTADSRKGGNQLKERWKEREREGRR